MIDLKPEKWNCPHCASYLRGRVYYLKPNGREAIPLCKTCGEECTDSANDDRLCDLNQLEEDVKKARYQLEYLKHKLSELQKEWIDDWEHDTPGDDKPLYTYTRQDTD